MSNEIPSPIPQETQVNLIGSLFSDVRTGIDGSFDSVRDTVVSHFIELEKNKRRDLLIAGLTTFKAAKKAVDDCRADVFTFDEAGKKTSETFSKQRVEDRKKALEQLGKVNKALTLCLEKQDFSLLSNIKSGPAKAESADESAS